MELAMLRHYHVLIVLVAFGLLSVTVGCPSESPEPPAEPLPNAAPGDDGAEPGEEEPAESSAESAEPAFEEPPLTMPEVTMTEDLAAMCLVGVGDPLPPAELPGLDGQRHSLESLFGRELTLVFFWKADDIYATTELADLGDDVAKPYAEKGVRVIGINVGDTPEAASAAVAEAGAAFPILLDPQGEYFAKVATGKIPRTYLVDAAGKILWFDMEYSAYTRDTIQRAVEVALGKDESE